MNPYRRLLSLALALIFLTRWCAAAESPKTVRLLTVGNSFSQNATRYLGDLVKASGHVLVHHQAAIGGATMAQHWEKAQQYERDSKDPRGLYSSRRSLRQELQAEKWDFVTIQQASIRSHDVATYRPYAKQLHDYIKQHAPATEVLIHQTWAYRIDDPRFKPTAAKGEPATQQAMYEGLTRAYETIAGELGVRIIPVGDAFHLADTDPAWAYRPDKQFDFKKAVQPALPVQTHSLHTGWRWGTAKDGKAASLGMDGHHASVAGQYLGGCVFFEMLFGESVVGNAFAPKELKPDDVRYLQQTAHKAVAARASRGTK